MNNALLDLGVRIARANGLGKAVQVIYTEDQDILNTPVFQIV